MARLVSRKALLVPASAMQALRLEWARLWNKQVFDWKNVRDEGDVAREPHRKIKTVVMGRSPLFLHACRHVECRTDDDRLKYECRVVFPGHAVIDQSWVVAVPLDIGRAYFHMELRQVVGYYKRLLGHAGQLSDAEFAYAEAKLKYSTNETWVAISEEVGVESWKSRRGYRMLVFRLREALYGHPDTGGFSTHTHTG